MHRNNKLGEGTFGIVYSAISPNTNKEYAVKRNLTEKKTSFIGAAREADILNKLRKHPHIVRLEKIAFGEPFKNMILSPIDEKSRSTQRNDTLHFVFGKAAYDLHRFIYGAKEKNFGLIKRYMVHILLGVEYMHSKKIIHRDLKPSNILIFGDDNDSLGISNCAKICDFGLSKPFTYQGYQTPNTVTSWYRPPEILLSNNFYDYKVDVWSMGCILFEMVAGRSFIFDIDDDNEKLLKAILEELPYELSINFCKKNINSKKWKNRYLRNYRPKKNFRKSFRNKFCFNETLLNNFSIGAGDLDIFCNLLRKMLEFNWNERCTITDALNHEFFKDYSCLINTTRKHYNLYDKEYLILIKPCIERKWMSDIAINIFNNRKTINWYTPRILFQAMDLFDRYLIVMFQNTKIHPNAIESDNKGFIHDKFNSELRFYTCIYLCIKYFSSIHVPISFTSILPSYLINNRSLLIAESFEGGFIKNCLEYNIYRPTIYESADSFNDYLSDQNIRDLIILYTKNNTISKFTPSKLYHYYKFFLKDKSIDDLLLPIEQEI